MNPTIIFPAPEPTLKLSRPSAEKWAAALEEERRRLIEDQEALREREENLRHYEARLRALQEEITAARTIPPAERAAPVGRGLSRVPFEDGGALAAGWDKLHRARELLEAEQAHLREDRHAIREQEQALKQREATVEARERAVAEREAELGPILAGHEPVGSEHTMSAMTRLTRVPFDMARSVFGGRR